MCVQQAQPTAHQRQQNPRHDGKQTLVQCFFKWCKIITQQIFSHRSHDAHFKKHRSNKQTSRQHMHRQNQTIHKHAHNTVNITFSINLCPICILMCHNNSCCHVRHAFKQAACKLDFVFTGHFSLHRGLIYSMQDWPLCLSACVCVYGYVLTDDLNFNQSAFITVTPIFVCLLRWLNW